MKSKNDDFRGILDQDIINVAYIFINHLLHTKHS